MSEVKTIGTFDVATWRLEPKLILAAIEHEINLFLGERMSGVLTVELKEPHE